MNLFGTFGSTKAEALRLLMPVVDRALHAHQVADYRQFLSVVTDELAGKTSEERFMRAHRDVAPKLGALQSKSFLASLRRNKDPMLVFCAKYSSTQDDILISVTFENGTEPPLINWLWIE